MIIFSPIGVIGDGVIYWLTLMVDGMGQKVGMDAAMAFQHIIIQG